MRHLFFPDPHRRLPGDRVWRVGLRTVHIIAMGILLGGLAYQVPAAQLIPVTLAAGASGWMLLGLDLWKSGEVLFQGSGVAVLLKLGCLGLGRFFLGQRFQWYLLAAVIASVGAHMSGRWRHFDFRFGRVVEKKPRT